MFGFAVSLVVSYLGHAYFTFQVDTSQHSRFGFRFLVVAIILTISCSLLAQLAVKELNVPATYTTGIIALLYPIASFILHAGWSFVAPEFIGVPILLAGRYPGWRRTPLFSRRALWSREPSQGE